jgi:hypothetical protein
MYIRDTIFLFQKETYILIKDNASWRYLSVKYEKNSSNHILEVVGVCFNYPDNFEWVIIV